MPITEYNKFTSKYGLGQKFEEIKESDLLPLKSLLLNEIYELLSLEGISSFMNGFLWTLNPSEHIDWLNDWLKFEATCIPFARTALGDMFFVTEGTIAFLHSSEGLIEYVTKKIDWFFEEYLWEDEYVDEYFHRQYFNELATEKITFDECFGFYPLLSDGGDKVVNNLKKVKLKDYLIDVSTNRKTVKFIKV